MSDNAFPIIFNDGKQGYHKGTVAVTMATTFDSFLRQVSSRIPGLDPQHFHIQIVCSRAGAPPDARQYIPIHENTSFCVVLNQHSPMADQAAHFLVTLKRPEQRQLDQQRKMMHQQQRRILECMEEQGQQAGSHQLPHQLGNPPPHHRRQQGSLTGAAYPWAGMPHPPVTPQMQQAWNAAQEPPIHSVQLQSKRQANMWGAVPQHHNAPVAQAQAHHIVMAHAQAAAQAHAQAQAMRHVPEPPPPPPALLGGFSHSGHAQTAHAQASAAFQTAQHTQHAQHGAGFVMPPPPPPAIPNFSNAPRSFAVTAQTDTWNRGSIPAIHMHQAQGQAQGSPARPQGIPRSQQPPPPSSPPPSRLQPAEQPFHPTRILTHANPGRLVQSSRSGSGGQIEGALGQEPQKVDEGGLRTPSTGPPGSPAFAIPAASGFASLQKLKTSGSASLDDDFWCDSPRDHVLHRLHIRKQNPFGPVSSPHAGTHTITMDSVDSGLDSASSGVDSHIDNGDVGMHEAWNKVRHTVQMRS